MVIWKGWFETVPCRASLATPFPALCPRILGTRFTNYGVRMFWGEVMVIWKRWFETVPCRATPEHPIFSPLSKNSRNTVYKLRFAHLNLHHNGMRPWNDCRATSQRLKDGCGFFLLTVGSFLLTVELFYLQLTIWAFLLTVGAFLLTILASSLTAGGFLLTMGKCF